MPWWDGPQAIGAMVVVVWLTARGWYSARSRNRTPAMTMMTPQRKALLVLAQAMVMPTFVYYFTPWLHGSSWHVPEGIRWAGVAMMASAVGLLVWAHAALGGDFSTSVQTSAGHELVTSGPYRWVRHPMYAAFFLLGLALLPATANALVADFYLVGMTVVYLDRVAAEERLISEAFGPRYVRYMEGTGRLMPRLSERRE